MPVEASFVVARGRGGIVGALGIEGFLSKGIGYLLGRSSSLPNGKRLQGTYGTLCAARSRGLFASSRVGATIIILRCQNFLRALGFERQFRGNARAATDRFALHDASRWMGSRLRPTRPPFRKVFRELHRPSFTIQLTRFSVA